MDKKQIFETLMLEWLASNGPCEWHGVADAWHWDNGVLPLAWIIQQPDCDAATAALIYWCSRPQDLYKVEGGRDNCPAERADVYDLDSEICRRWNTDPYSTGRFSFVPSELGARAKDIETSADYADLNVCEAMIQPFSGSETYPQYQDGIPDEVYLKLCEMTGEDPGGEFPDENVAPEDADRNASPLMVKKQAQSTKPMMSAYDLGEDEDEEEEEFLPPEYREDYVTPESNEDEEEEGVETETLHQSTEEHVEEIDDADDVDDSEVQFSEVIADEDSSHAGEAEIEESGPALSIYAEPVEAPQVGAQTAQILENAQAEAEQAAAAQAELEANEQEASSDNVQIEQEEEDPSAPIDFKTFVERQRAAARAEMNIRPANEKGPSFFDKLKGRFARK